MEVEANTVVKPPDVIKKDQMTLNIEAYAKSYAICLRKARDVILECGDKKVDRQDVANTLFDQYWADQNAVLDRKVEAGKNNSLIDTLGQLRGRI